MDTNKLREIIKQEVQSIIGEASSEEMETDRISRAKELTKSGRHSQARGHITNGMENASNGSLNKIGAKLGTLFRETQNLNGYWDHFGTPPAELKKVWKILDKEFVSAVKKHYSNADDILSSVKIGAMG